MNQDKTRDRLNPYMTAAETRAEFVAHQAALAAVATPAERAADPTKAELQRLADAAEGWESARAAHNTALLAGSEARRAASAASTIRRVRAPGGTYDERPDGTEREIAALEAKHRAALDAARDSAASLHQAQQRYNTASMAVARAGHVRRSAAQEEENVKAFIAWRRGHGDERDDRELDDLFHHRGRYATETVRVRQGAA